MTQVDFYVLDSGAAAAREQLACRLADKACRRNLRVYIHTATREDATRMDDLLWTFRPGSFVPHELARPGAEPAAPVLIGHGDDPGDEHGVLINLDQTVPPFFSRFERVAEVVDGSPQGKQNARERFRFYRDRGYALSTHHVSDPGPDV
ncbi:MAG TPA: DNA polymerase III subunit chi [Gammaproteobacteria bacterium]|nr:DNA polymerase III subunit chi [Gammaproteobacteria bacterium]